MTFLIAYVSKTQFESGSTKLEVVWCSVDWSSGSDLYREKVEVSKEITDCVYLKAQLAVCDWLSVTHCPWVSNGYC